MARPATIPLWTWLPNSIKLCAMRYIRAARQISKDGIMKIKLSLMFCVLVLPVAATIHAAVVTKVAAGINSSLFLKSDGSLWAMGRNDYGQLGDGTTNNINLPKQILPGGVTAVAAGIFSSLFLKRKASLWAFGTNFGGQLGEGMTKNVTLPEKIAANGITVIAGGANPSLFLKSDGSLWGMGENVNYQLG